MKVSGILNYQAIDGFPTYSGLGETSPYVPSYTITQVDSGGVWTDHWHDGPKIAYLASRIFILGGWNGGDTPASTDLVRYSDDGGDTWADWGTPLPYNAHSFILIQTQDGWWYFIGGDGDCTPTERKTVHRTRDFITWELRTANAEWASAPGGDRVLAAGVALDGNRIAIMGGQHPTTWSGYSDIWVSEDAGKSWKLEESGISVGGNAFLAQNIDQCVVRRDDNVYVIGGGIYDDNPGNRTYTAKCYVASIYDLSTWIRIDDSPLGDRQYAYCGLWDGMIWQVNGVDSGGTNQYGTVYLDKNNIWHNINDSYRSTYPGQMSISHAAPILGVGGAMYRIGGNGENQAWKITRSVKLFPESNHIINADVTVGDTGLTRKLGVNKLAADIASGYVFHSKGGRGEFESDSFDTLIVSTSTVSNNATGIGLYGGGTFYYLLSGGSSGVFANKFAIYQGGSNDLPFGIFSTERVWCGPGNTSASPRADLGYCLQVYGTGTNGGLYTEDHFQINYDTANENGPQIRLLKVGATGDINAGVANTGELGQLAFWGYRGAAGGSVSARSAYMISKATEDWGAGSGIGSKIEFYTTPNSSTTNTLLLTLWNDQTATFQKAIVINETGADSDTRIEGDTDANLVFVDASADMVGIGTTGPATKLDINGGLTGRADFYLSGDITPSQITSNQNNYNPTGLSGASVIRLDTDAARTITGLQGGADGRIITLYNKGSNLIYLANESGSSTAGNRFTIPSGIDQLTMYPKDSVVLQYDATDSRWNVRSYPPSSGVYTPSLTNSTNITSSSVYGTDGNWSWMRVGNVVSVSGQVNINATSANAETQLDFTLPFSMTGCSELAGNGSSYDGSNSVFGQVDSTGRLHYYSKATGTKVFSVHFQYRIDGPAC